MKGDTIKSIVNGICKITYYLIAIIIIVYVILNTINMYNWYFFPTYKYDSRYGWEYSSRFHVLLELITCFLGFAAALFTSYKYKKQYFAKSLILIASIIVYLAFHINQV